MEVVNNRIVAVCMVCYSVCNMRMFGGKKEEQFDGLLGVDIGPSGIKIVELAPEKSRIRLSTYGYSEFSTAVSDAVTLLDDPDKAAGIIRQILKDSGMKATRAVAALPSALVFQTIVTVPQGKSKEEMKALIENQASKLLPMPVGEMIVDSSVLDKELLADDNTAKQAPASLETQDDSGKYIRVLVTAAPKTLVAKYVDLFRKAKLELVSLETEVFALVRALVGKDKSRVMIADIGFSQTNIAVIDNGVPYLHRSMKGGGAMMTEALSQSLGMGYDDAERMKRDLTMAQGQMQPPRMVQRALDATLHEFRYALELYTQQTFHDNSAVEKIILTGGGALLPALAPYVTQQLGINVYVGNPWARIAAPPGLRPMLDEIGPRFSIALGLAMRINEE